MTWRAWLTCLLFGHRWSYFMSFGLAKGQQYWKRCIRCRVLEREL